MNIVTRLLIVTLLTLTCTALTPAPAAAEQSIAIVNVQKIMRESRAANSMREQMKQKQKQYQDELDKAGQSLQKQDQELAKQRAILSKEAFEKQQNDLRQNLAKAQQEAKQKEAQLNKAFSEALTQIQEKVTEIVAEIAKEKNFQLAIPKAQALYAADGLEITDDVLKRLDQKLPELRVNFN